MVFLSHIFLISIFLYIVNFYYTRMYRSMSASIRVATCTYSVSVTLMFILVRMYTNYGYSCWFNSLLQVHDSYNAWRAGVRRRRGRRVRRVRGALALQARALRHRRLCLGLGVGREGAVSPEPAHADTTASSTSSESESVTAYAPSTLSVCFHCLLPLSLFQ